MSTTLNAAEVSPETPPYERPPYYERPTDILRRVPVSRSWLYERIADGTLPSLRAGRSLIIPAGAIDRLLEDQAARYGTH